MFLLGSVSSETEAYVRFSISPIKTAVLPLFMARWQMLKQKKQRDILTDYDELIKMKFVRCLEQETANKPWAEADAVTAVSGPAEFYMGPWELEPRLMLNSSC